jgi:hydroxymethylbilane synthase
MGDRIRQRLSAEQILPAVGQGSVGLEAREGDDEVLSLISVLDDAETRYRITAERAMNHQLQGGCQVPIAGHALLEGDQLYLRGLVGEPDGSRIISGEIRGPKADAEKLGVQLADELLGRGARAILDKLYQNA